LPVKRILEGPSSGFWAEADYGRHNRIAWRTCDFKFDFKRRSVGNFGGFAPAKPKLTKELHIELMRLVITMPVRNDWDAAFQLCRRMDATLRQVPDIRARVLLIDDGSTTCPVQKDIPSNLLALERISMLELRRNLGHQRAIAVALAHLRQSWEADALVVMDADGEDRPEDILTLVGAAKKAAAPTAVFAERGKRLETVTFRAFYQVYRALHHVLTGRDIRFGNFSYIPWTYLDTLVVFPELWNHYAATFLKSGLPYVRVHADRDKRLAGRSQMSFVNLVMHGLSGLFANQEVVGTRVLIIVLLGSVLLLVGLASVLAVGMFTRLESPSWSATLVGLLIIVLAQALIATLGLIFLITMNRSQLGFLPIRDYAYFIRQETTLFER